MTLTDILGFLGIYGGFGSLGFLLFILLAWKAGLVDAVRDNEGEFKKKFTPKAALAIGSMLGFYLLFLILSDVFGLREFWPTLTFWQVVLLNYGLFLVLLLFDTFVIDILFVVTLHPTFLNLTNSPAHTSVAYHLKTIPKGMVLGVPMTLLSSLFCWLVL